MAENESCCNVDNHYISCRSNGLLSFYCYFVPTAVASAALKRPWTFMEVGENFFEFWVHVHCKLIYVCGGLILIWWPYISVDYYVTLLLKIFRLYYKMENHLISVSLQCYSSLDSPSLSLSLSIDVYIYVRRLVVRMMRWLNPNPFFMKQKTPVRMGSQGAFWWKVQWYFRVSFSFLLQGDPIDRVDDHGSAISFTNYIA